MNTSYICNIKWFYSKLMNTKWKSKRITNKPVSFDFHFASTRIRWNKLTQLFSFTFANKDCVTVLYRTRLPFISWTWIPIKKVNSVCLFTNITKKYVRFWNQAYNENQLPIFLFFILEMCPFTTKNVDKSFYLKS